MYIKTADGWKPLVPREVKPVQKHGDFGHGNPYKDKWNAMNYEEQYAELATFHMHTYKDKPVEYERPKPAWWSSLAYLAPK